ncbi:MAG TPA: ABC transporter permease, partial [Gemmatimonadales bacterium]|nr:ABC transporter permease [Gemmatimonadales bacterium]
MATLLQDLRFAARQLLKHRAWSVAIVAVLSLAMGTSLAVFTVLDAAFLRVPPVAAPDRLVWLETRASDRNRDLSYPEYREFRDRLDRFAALAAMTGTLVVLGSDVPHQARAELVSGNYFDVVGVRPELGRGFTAEEDQVPGSAAAVVLSDDLWRREFEASPDAIGRALVVNDRRFTVV